MAIETKATRAKSSALFQRACRSLVGGVNSPVRAFGAVGGDPIFVDRAEGPFIWDVDGNRSIDLVGSWGTAIVGHAHRDVVGAVSQAAEKGLSFGACCQAETELAEMILSALPGCGRIRLVNSGTEAVMSALRLARAATGRDGVVKFHGCYHGHADAMLVGAGSGASTHGVPDSAGVSLSTAQHTYIVEFNDPQACEHLLQDRGAQIAAVIVEPVPGNMGMVMPQAGFLQTIRDLCDRHGCLLIFDEVMTGFRVAWGGYQTLCDVKPDLTCLGKVIGGGMPIAAYAGPARLMEMVSPLGPVYQAGTLSGNPLGMAAGLATLQLCSTKDFYARLHDMTTQLTDGMRGRALAAGIPLQTSALGGMFGWFFNDRPVRNFPDAKSSDRQLFRQFFHAMFDRGVWLPPSPFEAMFMSAAHEQAHIDHVLEAAEESFRILRP